MPQWILIYDIPKCMTIKEIINKGKKCTLDVCGTIKWLEDKKIVCVRQNKVEKPVQCVMH